jgi:hypothetical protein
MSNKSSPLTPLTVAKTSTAVAPAASDTRASQRRREDWES